MQELTHIDREGHHCVLAASEECKKARMAILGELVAAGIPAPPMLVFDLVAAVHERSLVRVSCSSRPHAEGVFMRMKDARSAMEKVHGSVAGNQAACRRATKAFLASWFASVPKLAPASDSLDELELVAIGARAGGAARSTQWLDWRRREEASMQKAGSPEFLRALAEIRGGTPEGFAAIDERVWTIGDGDLATPRALEVASTRKSGAEAERHRSHIGAFHEVGSYSLPPDPTRLVTADLALLGSAAPSARALLVSKLADASLLVRFGSMPRPAARRPQVLLVAALEDDLASHVLLPGRVNPVVEHLREAMLHAIPACLRVLSELQIDFEAEIHRCGPFARGSLRLTDLRSRSGRLAPHYRSAPRLLIKLALDAPWMFADAPSRTAAPVVPPIGGFDASYLLIASSARSMRGVSRYRDAAAWSGCISIESADDGFLRIAASGLLSGASTVRVPVHEPERAAKAAAEAFGGGNLEQPEASTDRSPIEGVNFQ